VTEEIQAVSEFLVTAECLCTAVRYGLLGAANGLFSFPWVAAQTWSSWFKLAPSCRAPATGPFCLLQQG